MLTCRTCGRAIPIASARPGHEVVYRLNTAEGPGPFPYLVLHTPR